MEALVPSCKIQYIILHGMIQALYLGWCSIYVHIIVQLFLIAISSIFYWWFSFLLDWFIPYLFFSNIIRVILRLSLFSCLKIVIHVCGFFLKLWLRLRLWLWFWLFVE